MVQPGIEEARLAVEAIDEDDGGHPLAAIVGSYIWKCATCTARYVTDTRGTMKFQCISVIKTRREHILLWKLIESLLTSKKHVRLIGDRDTSVHRKLIETLPCGPNLLVQKNICMKESFENVELRSLILQNLLRLRTAVTKAASYRKAQQVPHHKKKLRIDVPEMKADGIFREQSEADEDYGPDAAVSDMPLHQLEVAKETYVQKLTSECIEEKIIYIECRTRGQSSTHEKRLTASNFGRSVREPTFVVTTGTEWGLEHEHVALNELSKHLHMPFRRSGLIIHP
ncbi:hypothetical protein PR048_020309 [Dryococelus australis]|uniref:Uncharacterized protein n=1 Tax=Dryococelus australis TaxID=614101 RepID=A0ABQ9H5Y9_9NEOP|nr:hypothetical protein PR048_020309 [Dryococelus australis]